MIKVLIVSFILSVSLSASNTYKCKVQEIAGLNEIEQKDFRMKNGKVDGDIYKIVLKNNALEFTNTSNNASMTMYEEKSDNSYRVYIDLWYSFELNEDTKHFIFGVHKMNFSANYIGYCENK